MSKPCPACHSSRTKHLAVIPDLIYETTDEEFLYRRCLDCEAIYLGNPPPPQEMGRYYPDIYGPYHQHSALRSRPRGIASLMAEKLWGRIAALYPFYRRRSRFFSTIRKGELLVDYGCGSGESLELARKFGARTCGIDFATSVIEDLKRRGHIGLLASQDWVDAIVQAGGADHIRMSHSLEHVLDPAELLQAIAKIARPGCHIYISVPNPNGLSARLFGGSWWGLDAPRHLVMMTTQRVCALLRGTGFDITAISTEPSANDFARSLAVFSWRRGWLRQKSNIRNFNEHPWALLLGLPLFTAAPVFGSGDRLHIFARRRS
jgi:2-polyprenyl-3-methyl-5-hydroxy-6-metoxy-1,4-benzoquinol methylase